MLQLQEELAATYQALQVAEARAAELAAGLEAERAAATAAADDKVSTATWSPTNLCLHDTDIPAWTAIDMHVRQGHAHRSVSNASLCWCSVPTRKQQ